MVLRALQSYLSVKADFQAPKSIIETHFKILSCTPIWLLVTFGCPRVILITSTRISPLRAKPKPFQNNKNVDGWHQWHQREKRVILFELSSPYVNVFSCKEPHFSKRDFIVPVMNQLHDYFFAIFLIRNKHNSQKKIRKNSFHRWHLQARMSGPSMKST